MLGVVTTCIVISACINHRIRALCDLGRQPMQRGNHFRRIRRISDVTVQYQYLRVRVRQRRMGRRDGIAVRICQSTRRGTTYYSFRLGPVWGIVLDAVASTATACI